MKSDKKELFVFFDNEVFLNLKELILVLKELLLELKELF